MAWNRSYICIDLKSFYASVECVERGLDAMTTNLVVADPERTDKTICLAVSPSMKALGVSNRCRVFQIPKNIDYIMAPPRMELYIMYSAEIYGIFLKYFSKDDIHVYSIDEAFIDVTDYMHMYHKDARQIGQMVMQDILDTMGITATCGVGENLYLAKIALDISAKHTDDHIGVLSEETYRQTLWNHRPLTDFWRVGKGTEKRLAKYGIMTMGQIAQADEDLLYNEFGIDAELLIDHAWGREPVTIADIKRYKPKSNGFSNGQVLPCDYEYEKAKIVVKEMTDELCLQLVDKKLQTASATLHIGYSNVLKIESARGSFTLANATSSSKVLVNEMVQLFERITNPHYPIRRITMSFNNVTEESYIQYDLFTNPEDRDKERSLQESILNIKKRYGKNFILRGMDLQDGATAIERNNQIGGHRKI